LPLGLTIGEPIVAIPPDVPLVIPVEVTIEMSPFGIPTAVFQGPVAPLDVALGVTEASLDFLLHAHKTPAPWPF
jgi:hypothetical protein